MVRRDRTSGRNRNGGYDLSAAHEASASHQHDTDRRPRVKASYAADDGVSAPHPTRSGSGRSSASASRAEARRSSSQAAQRRRSQSHSSHTTGQHSLAEGEAAQYARNAGQYRARKRGTGKRVALVVVLVLAVALVGCGVAAALWYGNLSSTIKGNQNISNLMPEEDGKPYYVLLLGGDSRADSMTDNRTDSIMVARVDEANQGVSILSVPRDLRINIEGHGYCKINSAIEYGGYDQVVSEVNELLGIQISYYAFIYFDGFEDLVDKLGGVTVEVPEGTYYNGVWVPAGDAVEINGQEALVLARCRHGYPEDQGAYAMGDYQRTLNQRNLIKAIAKKILKQDVTAYPSLIEGLASCVETNMDVTKIISLATAMRGMDTEELACAQLPVCGDVVGSEWFAALYEDVFQVMRSNFANGRELMKGLDDFDTYMNDNDLTSYCVDGELYAYTNYANIYGGTFVADEG